MINSSGLFFLACFNDIVCLFCSKEYHGCCVHWSINVFIAEDTANQDYNCLCFKNPNFLTQTNQTNIIKYFEIKMELTFEAYSEYLVYIWYFSFALQCWNLKNFEIMTFCPSYSNVPFNFPFFQFAEKAWACKDNTCTSR